MYQELVSEYFFSNKSICSFNKEQQMTLELARKILTTHGVGGKFVEELIQYKFDISEIGGIHGWDGKTKDNKFVEIKTETINKRKLNAMGSFGTQTDYGIQKDKLFLKETPILINVGVCDKTGKCIYVLNTRTEQLPHWCNLFKKLSACSPRISLTDFYDYKDAYSIQYSNKEIISKNVDRISVKLLKVLYR